MLGSHSKIFHGYREKTLNKDQLKDSAAYQVVNLMSPIFQAEAKFVKEQLVVPDVKEKRNSKEYKQMLTNLYDYVQSIQPERDTPLAKAVTTSTIDGVRC